MIYTPYNGRKSNEKDSNFYIPVKIGRKESFFVFANRMRFCDIAYEKLHKLL